MSVINPQCIDPTRYTENKINPKLMGIHALNPFIMHVSASRGQMFFSHIGSRPTLIHPMEKTIQSGMEYDIAKSTFMIKMPENGVIVKIIERYPKTIDINNINKNPEKIVIYRNPETGQYGHFIIEEFKSVHQNFGFEYKFTEEANKITPGAFIAKDTIFAHSPQVHQSGSYMFGREINVCFSSKKEGAEDGFIFSENAIKMFSFCLYEKRKIVLTKEQYLKSIYSDEVGVIKPLPEMGEMVHPSAGILAAIADIKDNNIPCDLSIYDIGEIDYTFDKKIFTNGPLGEVVDIDVVSDNNNELLVGTLGTFSKYEEACKRFNKEIVKTYYELVYQDKRQYGEHYETQLEDPLWSLILNAMAKVNEPHPIDKSKLILLDRKKPIDQLRIEYTIKYVIEPTRNFKFTDCHGGKGVAVSVVPVEQMPRDQDGNIADVVISQSSIVSRSNPGRVIEQYLYGCKRDITKRMRQWFGLDINKVSKQQARQAVLYAKDNNQALINQSINYLMEFYDIVSHSMSHYFSNAPYETWLEHLVEVLNTGVKLLIRTDNKRFYRRMIKELEAKYPQTYKPIWIWKKDGTYELTKKPIRIAPMYIMLLDKIADTGSSVASASTQHFGVLSPITQFEKFTSPQRSSPVKNVGEAEGAILAATTGREATAEYCDRNNNPLTHQHQYRNILQADKPTNIYRSVDRNIVPLGGSKPLMLFKHMLFCRGAEIKWVTEAKSKDLAKKEREFLK